MMIKIIYLPITPYDCLAKAPYHKEYPSKI